MKIIDKSIILSRREYGENALLITAFTENHGLLRGLSKGKPQAAILQPANICEIVWNARLEEHLGMLRGELLYSSYPALMDNPQALQMLGCALQLCELYLPPRDPHERLYQALKVLLSDKNFLHNYFHFELTLLQEMGFGLDLGKCAATGSNDNLIYISPKTGRAVSASAGAPYADKMFNMPAFLLEDRIATPREAFYALEISLYFMDKWLAVQTGREIPQMRRNLLKGADHENSTISGNISQD